MRLVLLGAPGSGKGTQAERLTAKYRIPHVSTGNILRLAIEHKTELGTLANTYIKEGKLVPDAVIIRVVEERLAQSDCSLGFILDGFPRTVTQAEMLKQWTVQTKQSLTKVVYFQVSESTLIKRLINRRVCSKCEAIYHLITHPPKIAGKCDLCGNAVIQRPDDEETTVINRLKVYKELTEPLLEYYQKLDLLLVVDGENNAETIFVSLVTQLTKS
ncbi:MAG: adenylate kinase [bacterium]